VHGDFLDAVTNGTLPSVSWIVPGNGPISEHPGTDGPLTDGQAFVTRMVNTVMRSDYWDDTAIFITWDDWGGLYDHVKPPQADYMGLGFRVPLIVVSPFAKKGHVSKVQHEFGSILKFTEAAMGLPALHDSDPDATDDRADDLRDCFDFSQTVQPLFEQNLPVPREFFIQEAPSDLPPDDD